MKKYFASSSYSLCTDVSLVILRVIVGVAFMMHGWGKIQTPMSWMPPESPVPGIFQFLAALSEFGGGLGLILGLLFRLSSAGLCVTMAVAVSFHAFVLGDPFISAGGGSFELPAAYFALSLFFIVAGPGRFALDTKLFGKCDQCK